MHLEAISLCVGEGVLLYVKGFSIRRRGSSLGEGVLR